MNTAAGPGSANWSSMTSKQWCSFFQTKSKRERRRFEKQLLAVLSYGNQVARDYATRILGEYHTYSRFHTILAKLARLPTKPFTPENFNRTAKVFDLGPEALQRHLAACGGNEMTALCKLLVCSAEQLVAILNIPAQDRRFIDIWRECCPLFQAQYEPMLERISKSLFQQWFLVKQASDRRDCFGDTGLAICKAVRGYSNTRIKFITYAWHATHREIKRAIYRKFGKTAMSARLGAEYATVEHQLLVGGKRAKPDDVYTAMGLQQSQIDALERSKRRRVVQEIELDAPLDELKAGRGADRLPSDLLELIASVELVPLERAAFEAADTLREYFNNENFSDVARRLGYSSQAVADALKRARIKITRRLLARVKFTAVQRAVFEGRMAGKEFYQIAESTGLPEAGLRKEYAVILHSIEQTFGTIYGLAQ